MAESDSRVQERRVEAVSAHSADGQRWASHIRSGERSLQSTFPESEVVTFYPGSPGS